MLAVVYDGDCGFCTRSVTFSGILLGQEAPEFIASGKAAEPLRSAGVPPHLTKRFLLLMDRQSDRCIARGASVFVFLTAIKVKLVFGKRAAVCFLRLFSFAPMRFVLDFPYVQITRVRHHLPGGTANCRI